MATLDRFATPGGVNDPNPDAWDVTVKGFFAAFTGSFPQFYDPTEEDTPAEAQTAPIAWTAFPATSRLGATSEEQRWQAADNSPLRQAQDEYCEWSVERDASERLTAVTFTTELPEYWDHLAEHDRDRLVQLYRELVSPDVEEADLFDGETYDRRNDWNIRNVGRPAHLIQDSNALTAAIKLVAEATVLREDANGRVTGNQALVICAGLGNPFRNSDPQIADAVNDAAARGAEVTLADPVGVYIGGLVTTGMVTPDGTDPAEFWTIERGDADRALRTRFAVPEEAGYIAADIKAGDRPLTFGAQLADRVSVVVHAVVKPGNHQPQPRPCV